jgi:hypothetical protein
MFLASSSVLCPSPTQSYSHISKLPHLFPSGFKHEIYIYLYTRKQDQPASDVWRNQNDYQESKEKERQNAGMIGPLISFSYRYPLISGLAECILLADLQ